MKHVNHDSNIADIPVIQWLIERVFSCKQVNLLSYMTEIELLNGVVEGRTTIEHTFHRSNTTGVPVIVPQSCYTAINASPLLHCWTKVEGSRHKRQNDVFQLRGQIASESTPNQTEFNRILSRIRQQTTETKLSTTVGGEQSMTVDCHAGFAYIIVWLVNRTSDQPRCVGSALQ
jgi:hypothetical protein